MPGTLPATMSGVVLTGHGGPETLVYRTDLPVPAPGPGDVVLKVGAAGVNNTDINTRLAWYSKGDGAAEDATWSGAPLAFPRIQGIDACGTVVAVGDGVDPGRIGQRVLVEPCLYEAEGQTLDTPWFFGSECDGAFAEYTKVAGRHAHPIDSPLSDAELALFPCSYSTAENMLTRARVGEGDTVLVTGASGGVGSAAVQLARARGAAVIAQTGAAKAAGLRALGAARTVDRGADLIAELGKNAVDVVLDLVGGPQWPSLPEVLRPGGRYAVSGAIAGAAVTLDLRTLYLKDQSFFGCTALAPGVFPNLVRLIEQRQIQPLVAATYPLTDIHAAQAAFLAKAHIGKIVLRVAD